jgi:CelD/BcsL family acetyltransferase involved in cellulose biosynthesis
MVDQMRDFQRMCADTWDVRMALSSKIHRLAAEYSGPTIMGIILSDAAELADDHDAWAHETPDTAGSRQTQRSTENAEHDESTPEGADPATDARESVSEAEANNDSEVGDPRTQLQREAGSEKQTRVWRTLLVELATMMSTYNFESWFETMVCRRSSPQRVELVEADVFRQAWIHDSYGDLMVQAAERAGFEGMVFKLDCIDPDAPEAKVWGGEVELAAAE